jgi:hypothetical protein
MRRGGAHAGVQGGDDGVRGMTTLLCSGLNSQNSQLVAQPATTSTLSAGEEY